MNSDTISARLHIALNGMGTAHYDPSLQDQPLSIFFKQRRDANGSLLWRYTHKKIVFENSLESLVIFLFHCLTFLLDQDFDWRGLCSVQ